MHAALLAPIASGERLVVLALQERGARYREDICTAIALEAQGKYTLSAIKNIVPAGDKAQAFIVPALLEGSLAMFLVEASAAGVSTRGYSTQDGSRAASLVLKDSPATLITRDGESALVHAIDIGIACACAQGVGIMDQTLAVTVEYMNTRKQFGVAISTFQALRHRVADMKMALELARSMSYYASLKLNSTTPERRKACARAKYQLGVSMRMVGQSAVQLHGGIGVTEEYIVSHYFKALTQLELTLGDSLHHLGRVSDGMQESAGVFA
jgi:alkylation response protein AidB-like acyl-CoA dehydrogenase